MILKLFYPPLCVHCEEETLKPSYPLCSACLEQLRLLQTETKRGERSSFPLTRVASVGEYYGPLKSLLDTFKGRGCPALASGLAALMAAYFIELGWPLPDMVVPVPSPPFRNLRRGYEPAFLLAQEIGKIVSVPVFRLLKRQYGYPPQSCLPFAKRKTTPSHLFVWKEKKEIAGKTILLVDDLIHTGTSLRASAYRLSEGFPRAIYGLTLCGVS